MHGLSLVATSGDGCAETLGVPIMTLRRKRLIFQLSAGVLALCGAVLLVHYGIEQPHENDHENDRRFQLEGLSEGLFNYRRTFTIFPPASV